MLLSAHSLSVPDGSSPSRAYGLPYLGTQFTRFSNTQANVHYGVTYPLSMRKRGYWAENGYDGPPF